MTNLELFPRGKGTAAVAASKGKVGPGSLSMRARCGKVVLFAIELNKAWARGWHGQQHCSTYNKGPLLRFSSSLWEMNAARLRVLQFFPLQACVPKK